MKFKKAVLMFVLIALSGCVSTPQSTAPTSEVLNNREVNINKTLVKQDIFPEHSYPVGDSGFQLVQTKGGSVFLGPILGSMNIAKNSKEMAQAIENNLHIISPYEIAKQTLLTNHFIVNADSNLVITPFVFLQNSEDGFFRMSLVHHVKDANSQWVGRYTYHIEEPVKTDQFPSGINNANFEDKLKIASQTLVDIMKRDFAGQLPNVGQKHYLGSLHLVGEKMGGLGIYTQPEELYFQDAQVINETNSDIIVRMQGNFNAVPFMGGLAFGVHYFKKSLLHKFEKM